MPDAEITFVDHYRPDEESLAAAAAALERGDSATVRWPERTASVLARKEAGRATILSELEKRGGGAEGVKDYDNQLGQAQRYASAQERLPVLWEALASAGVGAAGAAPALETFVRFANLGALASLARIELQGEGLPLEEDLRKGLLSELFNSDAGRSALGAAEPIYAVDVRVGGREPSGYAFAPKALVADLAVGDRVEGELWTRWAIPQLELNVLVRGGAAFDYTDGTPTAAHVRDDSFKEIG